MSEFDKAISICNGVSNLAAKLSEISGKNVTPQRVSNWRHRGVPLEFCPFVERAVGGEVTRKQLRSDINWNALADINQEAA